jgi:D-methionine transport system substrate-binding protein
MNWRPKTLVFSAVLFSEGLMNTKISIIVSILVLWVSFWGISSLRADPMPVIRVGLVRGQDQAILEKLQEILAREGLGLKLQTFYSSWECLQALAGRQIELSVSQHKPMLEAFVQQTGSLLIPLGNTYAAPLGFYSQTIKSLSEIEPRASLVVPEEPDRKRRSLQLLQQSGLIKLQPGRPRQDRSEIADNPYDLNIFSAGFVRSFLNNDSVTAIAFSAMSSEISSLLPARFPLRLLCREADDSPYIYVVVSRLSGKNNPYFQAFVQAYQSPEMARFLLEHFEGSIIPVFDFD